MTPHRATILLSFGAALAIAGCGGSSPAPATSPPPPSAPLGRPIGPSATPPAAIPTPARIAARRFLGGYLAAVYGRGAIDDIHAATPLLLQLLRRQAGRVPPAQRTRHPRVTQLTLVPITAARLRGHATVDDGDLAPYPLPFTLEHRASGRWLVIDVGQ